MAGLFLIGFPVDDPDFFRPGADDKVDNAFDPSGAGDWMRKSDFGAEPVARGNYFANFGRPQKVCCFLNSATGEWEAGLIV